MSPVISGGGGSGGASAISSASVTLTSAQIKALSGTPIALLAGVAGSIINVIQEQCVLHAGATPYTDGGADADFAVQQANGNYTWSTVAASAFATAAASSWAVASQTTLNNDATANESGDGLVVKNRGTNLTLGNGTVTVTILYSLLPVT